MLTPLEIATQRSNMTSDEYIELTILRINEMDSEDKQDEEEVKEQLEAATT